MRLDLYKNGPFSLSHLRDRPISRLSTYNKPLRSGIPMSSIVALYEIGQPQQKSQTLVLPIKLVKILDALYSFDVNSWVFRDLIDMTACIRQTLQ